jgi:hypothetical protein
MWRKLRAGISDLGWRNGILYFVSRVLESLTRGRCRIVKYYFVAQPVPDHRFASALQTTAISIRRVAPDDPIVNNFPRPTDVVARRFADGAVCIVAAKSDALMGFVWIMPGEYMEDEVRCLYVLEPPGVAAWDFDVWVAPENRLTRTFARLWDVANAFLRERGYLWSISRISAFNAGSLASHQRLGAQKLGSGLFLLLGQAQIAVFNCRPFFHLSAGPGSYPVLRVRAPRLSGNSTSSNDGQGNHV